MKASYEAGDVDVKRQVLEIVKRRVVKDYFIIGILEQFEDTLALFEIMLPMFYKGATDAWKSDCKYLITSGCASNPIILSYLKWAALDESGRSTGVK